MNIWKGKVVRRDDQVVTWEDVTLWVRLVIYLRGCRLLECYEDGVVQVY